MYACLHVYLWVHVSVCECTRVDVSVCEYMRVWVSAHACMSVQMSACECMWGCVRACECTWVCVCVWKYDIGCKSMWMMLVRTYSGSNKLYILLILHLRLLYMFYTLRTYFTMSYVWYVIGILCTIIYQLVDDGSYIQKMFMYFQLFSYPAQYPLVFHCILTKPPATQLPSP